MRRVDAGGTNNIRTRLQRVQVHGTVIAETSKLTAPAAAPTSLSSWSSSPQHHDEFVSGPTKSRKENPCLPCDYKDDAVRSLPVPRCHVKVGSACPARPWAGHVQFHLRPSILSSALARLDLTLLSSYECRACVSRIHDRWQGIHRLCPRKRGQVTFQCEASSSLSRLGIREKYSRDCLYH